MARGQAEKPPVFLIKLWQEAKPINLPFLFYVFTSTVDSQWITNGRWTAFAALYPYYLIAFDLVNCSCAPSTDGSVTTGDDANVGDDVSRFRNWIQMQQFQFLHYNSTFVEVDFAKCFLHYIRTISLPLISWIALALHQLMDPPIPRVSAVTILHFHISASPGRLGLQQVQALHYYISTTSLRLILWIVFALHPYYFTDSSAVQDQLRGVWHIWELHSSQFFFMECGQHLFTSLQNYLGSTRTTRQPQKTYVRGTPVPWTSPSSMARG